ncbi:hypothetical protein WICPIJ_002326 [Wickerhamomyces pijperi]|uniref:Protein kinase domain-containing protein n=1 Tax=Wickerhamomyces pijperi TaxID=599730 RepID=A0A9P8QBX1_WICPI|nr:hypothetical protein WICPIJ_002326 [Wickerhamomyces pijperi]
MTYDPVFALEEDEDRSTQVTQLQTQFQDSLNLNQTIHHSEHLAIPIPIPATTQRQRRRSSNRNTPQHRLGSSYEIELSDSYTKANSSLNIPSLSTIQSSSDLTAETVRPSAGPKASDFQPIIVLGEGSYGKVILVRENKTGKLYAMKKLKKASLIIQTKTIERTMTEKTILERVKHPNIVKLYYSFQDHERLYLILEYIQGGELFQHLQIEKFVSETDAAVHLSQIVLALQHLHSIGIIYRDLKPENCLLDTNGFLILTDFGLSKESLSEDDRCTSLIGTPEYMAPEILQDVPYDNAVDFWSLGCVMHDMLTGGPPFTGNSNKIIYDKITTKKLKLPFYLSLDAKDLIQRLLQKNPQKRLTNWETLQKHRFFRNVDWGKIASQDFIPPIVPIITDPILAENFDQEFTNKIITPLGSYDGQVIDGENPFKGFSYVDNSFKDIYG